jgi:hypothetical protein
MVACSGGADGDMCDSTLVDCRDTIEAMVASKRDRLEKIMDWRAFYSRSPIDNATNVSS